MPTALLVIDVQQAFCEGKAAAFEVARVIERINVASAKARAAGAPVIFVQHETPAGLLAHGTPAWQLAQGLETAAGDLFIRKTTPDSFQKTDLEATLTRHGVTEVAICGLHSEFCVDTTTRRAAALGYPVTLVADAHSTQDKEHLSAAQIIRHHNETLTNVTSFGPRIRAVPAAAVEFGAG